MHGEDADDGAGADGLDEVRRRGDDAVFLRKRSDARAAKGGRPSVLVKPDDVAETSDPVIDDIILREMNRAAVDDDLAPLRVCRDDGARHGDGNVTGVACAETELHRIIKDE